MFNLKYIFIRERIIKSIRSFFYNQNFHEVITPVLNKSIPLEPNIYPFQTVWKTNHGKRTFFLPTSPEKNLKKILAMGVDNCFSIGHSFRNLENSGSLHSPEFLMLEWYRKNANYKDIMKDLQQLIVSLIPIIENKSIHLPKKWSIFSLPELFKKYTKIDLLKFIFNKNNRADYDKIFVNEIESRLPKDPLFIIDYPSIISPLCKPKKENPQITERFEFYWQGIELANGNTENTDIESIKKNLRKPVDIEFIESLNKMKDASYAGVGLGIDRLTMLFSNSSHLL
jgi:elongation factor P--(R)-beta-lysine ligase